MTEEKTKVLSMLSDGKITVEEAADMLNALRGAAPTPPAPPEVAVKVESAESPAEPAAPKAPEAPVAEAVEIEVDEDDDPATPPKVIKKVIKMRQNGDSTGSAKRLRITVTDTASEHRRVNISIPAGVLRFGMNIGRRFTPDIDGLDWDEVETILREGMKVEVEEDNERVEIILE
jgi:hypothetical protein